MARGKRPVPPPQSRDELREQLLSAVIEKFGSVETASTFLIQYFTSLDMVEILKEINNADV